jgi:hypothetical protein
MSLTPQQRAAQLKAKLNKLDRKLAAAVKKSRKLEAAIQTILHSQGWRRINRSGPFMLPEAITAEIDKLILAAKRKETRLGKEYLKSFNQLRKVAR